MTCWLVNAWAKDAPKSVEAYKLNFERRSKRRRERDLADKIRGLGQG